MYVACIYVYMDEITLKSIFYRRLYHDDNTP